MKKVTTANELPLGHRKDCPQFVQKASRVTHSKGKEETHSTSAFTMDRFLSARFSIKDVEIRTLQDYCCSRMLLHYGLPIYDRFRLYTSSGAMDTNTASLWKHSGQSKREIRPTNLILFVFFLFKWIERISETKFQAPPLQWPQ